MTWRFPAQLIDNYDGDTLTLDLDLGFKLRLRAAVRLRGCDTPELRGGTPATKALARLARREAARLVGEASEALFTCHLWGGKYGRPVGDLSCDGRDLAEHLVGEGLGVAYDGGSREAIQARHQANAEKALREGRIAL